MYLIFGGSRGIGAALAASLRASCQAVVIVARGQEDLSARAEQLDCQWALGDARDFARVEEIMATYPGCQGVACCAGEILLKPAHLTSEEELQRCFEQNLKAAFAVVRAAGRKMESGSVLLFSSAAAGLGLANHEAVAATKGAIESLVRSAAATYCARGLRFNAIAPGLVRTSLSEKIIRRPAALEASAALHPLGRIGEPEEVAQLGRWLLSPESSWVTGQVYGMDGGLSRLRPK